MTQPQNIGEILKPNLRDGMGMISCDQGKRFNSEKEEVPRLKVISFPLRI